LSQKLNQPKLLAISTYSYGNFWLEIERRGLEIKKYFSEGQILFNIGTNNTNFIINHFAILYSKCIVAPIDENISYDGFVLLKEVCTSSGIITSQEHKIEFIDYQIISRQKGFNLLKSLLIEPMPHQYFKNECDVIMFTTGSTGNPKGVMLTQEIIAYTSRNIVECCGYTHNSMQLITLPLSHSFGLGQLYSMILVGGSAYLEKGMARGKRIKSIFENYPITGFPTTPLGVDLILNMYKDIFKQHAPATLSDMVINSSPLSKNKAIQLMKLLPNISLYVYYGMTEASRATMFKLNDYSPEYYEHVGITLGENCIEIDQDSNEIIISGKNVAIGYYGQLPLEKYGLNGRRIRTGDLGALESNGMLKIIGRIKDQINIGGYKVSPFEIERHLDELDNVMKSVAVGYKLDGHEQVGVFIVKNDQALDLDIVEIFQYLKRRIEPYKIPNKVIFLESVPLLINGKIDRKLLAKMIDK
jgi:long-chain acyl-CoA synthetase